MTPAEEDALIASLIDKHPGMAVVSPHLLRLAIRAAYARGVEAERERAAKAAEGQKIDFAGEYNLACENCAAAIRRGE